MRGSPTRPLSCTILCRCSLAFRTLSLLRSLLRNTDGGVAILCCGYGASYWDIHQANFPLPTNNALLALGCKKPFPLGQPKHVQIGVEIKGSGFLLPLRDVRKKRRRQTRFHLTLTLSLTKSLVLFLRNEVVLQCALRDFLRSEPPLVLVKYQERDLPIFPYHDVAS